MSESGTRTSPPRTIVFADFDVSPRTSYHTVDDMAVLISRGPTCSSWVEHPKPAAPFLQRAPVSPTSSNAEQSATGSNSMRGTASVVDMGAGLCPGGGVDWHEAR